MEKMGMHAKYERGNYIHEKLLDSVDIYERVRWHYIKESDFEKLEQVVTLLKEIIKDIEYKDLD